MNNLSAQKNTRTATSSYRDSDAFNFGPSLLGSLKDELVWKLSAAFSDVESRLVNQAVNEAQALAAQTEVPHLVLPVLAEEKVQALRKWKARQQQMFQGRSLAHAA